MMRLSATEHRALRLVRYTPGITRGAIADRTGLSASVVNAAVSRLLDHGSIVETRARQPSRRLGRPSSELRANGPVEVFALVLWSHGVLELALHDFAGTLLRRSTATAPRRPNSATILEAASELVDTARHLEGVARPAMLVLGVLAPYQRGVGLPAASIDDPARAPGALPAEQYSDWFDGDPLAAVTEALSVPAIAVNDANLAALGEVRDGAAADSRCVITIQLSARGVGSAIVIRGDLFEGAHGYAGELAHVRVDERDETLCICGSRGCLMGRLGERMLAPLSDIYGEPIDYGRLLELAESDEPGPVRVLEDAGRLLGSALSVVATTINPDTIVVDAGTPTASAIVLQGLTERIQTSCPPFIRAGLRLRVSALGPDAALRGALHVARAAMTRPVRTTRRGTPSTPSSTVTPERRAR